jgi:hypothetical protein
MRGMANLHVDLSELLSRYRHSETPEVQDLVRDLDIILDTVRTYQHRHHPKWDSTWMNLESGQVGRVLVMGHIVERRLIAGDWETVNQEDARVSD